jgi:lipopolysaccharide export system permease protein
MVAIAGVLMGEFQRGGYARRIVIASVIAMVVRLAALAAQAAAADEPELNVVQYAIPIGVVLIAAMIMGGKRARRKRLAPGPSVLAEAGA